VEFVLPEPQASPGSPEAEPAAAQASILPRMPTSAKPDSAPRAAGALGVALPHDEDIGPRGRVARRTVGGCRIRREEGPACFSPELAEQEREEGESEHDRGDQQQPEPLLRVET